MTFDKEEHRKIILEMLEAVPISGAMLDEIYNFKQTVLKAKVVKKDD